MEKLKKVKNFINEEQSYLNSLLRATNNTECQRLIKREVDFIQELISIIDKLDD